MDSYGNGNRPIKIPILKYKINDKIWLRLKYIITATENKKLDTKQTKYTILKNMRFYNFRLNTHQISATFFTSINCVQFQRVFYFPKFQMIIIQTQRSSAMKTVPTNMTSNFFFKSCGYQYLVKWKIYARFIWEPTSIMENTVALDEFETNLN